MPYGCALTKHINVASKTAANEKKKKKQHGVLHSGAIVNVDFLYTKEY